MAHLPRGIAPELLVSQIKNTMPYLFEEGAEKKCLLEGFPPARFVLDYAANPPETLTHFEYYRLCLSAHYLTVATPVPTDVDNQIRQKLWPAQVPLETALEMAKLVLESRQYDFVQVTNRFVGGAVGTDWEKGYLSGHVGEWFTVAAGAYCALGQYADPAAKAFRDELYANIADEVHRHSEVFGTLWRAQDGLGSLRASAAIAHNFGDLDRVMDMWELNVADPLRLNFYKLGAQPFDTNGKLRYLGRLWVAGELYKSEIDGSSMALENHRHFALRKPKCLRRKPSYMIHFAPFYDDWGLHLAKEFSDPSGAPNEDALEVFETLKTGWVRQPKTLAYGRAIRSFLQVHPNLDASGLTKDHLKLIAVIQEKFEKHWSEEAMRLIDDIPSRA